MMKRFSALILAVTAALSLCACADSKSDGLEIITVNGKTVDLTQDKESIAETLGEDYCEWEEYLSQSDEGQVAYLVYADTLEENDYTVTQYVCGKVDSGEPVGVTVWGDNPADMTQIEYIEAYDCEYCLTDFSDWQEYMIVQADGKILSPEEYYTSDDPEADAYHDLVAMVERGEIQELVLMMNIFDEEGCFACTYQIYKSKN